MKLIKKIAGVVLLAALVPGSHAGTITAKGSDTLVVLAQKWAEVYNKNNPETKIQVTGGGTGTGFAALQNQTTELCNASRKIRSTEIEACIKAFGKRPTEYKVALDGLSVYVNEENKVKDLSLPQLEAIFTGKIKNWSQVGGPDAGITIYSRENSSGTYEFFKENVLKGKDFAASAQTMPGTAALLQAVARDKNAIGYGGAAYGQGARAVPVKKDSGSKAIEANEETVIGGTYPIWRYLYVYVNPTLDKDEVRQYITWIRGEDGQKLVKEIGYYPLPAQFRAK